MTRESHYWFPAKRFGWGWGLPSVWQGWVVLGVFLLFIFGAGSFFQYRHLTQYFPGVAAILTAALVLICWLKGEPTRWRWGKD